MIRVHTEMDQPELSVHGYVLRHGKRFISQYLTPREEKYVNLHSWQRHRKKQCYRNAQSTALAMPQTERMKLRYAEGFFGIQTGSEMEIGIHHAWLSLNGKLVDTTLRTQPGNLPIMGIIPENWEYYGVELDPLECLHSLDHRAWTPLIDDWECGWPMLTREDS